MACQRLSILSQIQPTLQTNSNHFHENKKVISSLKQEISNIRQGMSKLLRVKSQQKLNFQQPSKENPQSALIDILQVKELKVAPVQDQLLWKQKELECKVKKLEEENIKLRNSLDVLQQQRCRERTDLEKSRRLFVTEKNRLDQQISVLTQLLETQQTKKTKSQSKKSSRSSAHSCQKSLSHIIQNLNNPQQTPTTPIIIAKSVLHLQQQKSRMQKDIQFLQNKLKTSQTHNHHYIKLITSLNIHKIKQEAIQLNQKYAHLEEQDIRGEEENMGRRVGKIMG